MNERAFLLATWRFENIRQQDKADRKIFVPTIPQELWEFDCVKFLWGDDAKELDWLRLEFFRAE